MRLAIQLLVLTGLGLNAGAVSAYGPTGHILVGDVAMDELCDAARDSVRDLLGEQRLGGASRWPDWIRRDPEWVRSGPWHYINVADDQQVLMPAPDDSDNVLGAIRRFREELADRNLSSERRAEALKFLAHFIGDVHQPLHVGLEADRGGNRVDVVAFGRRTNLHRVWDAEDLLRRDGARLSELSEEVRLLARSRRDEWADDPLLAWAEESKGLRSEVYGFAAPRAGDAAVLDQAYLTAARKITLERLAKAGVRLGVNLNQILCNDNK